MSKAFVNGLLIAAFVISGAAQGAEQAATATLAVGTVQDVAPDGSSRTLRDGDLVYSGDVITTGDQSYADLDFTDGGTITLRPDTQFGIENYHFDEQAHLTDVEPDDTSQPQPTASSYAPPMPQENAFFRLLKGGLRAVSGLIGHVQRDDYRMDTPTATIGIRGTEYDARYCDSNCPTDQGTNGSSSTGLYTGVDKGSIAVSNQSGSTVTRAGQYLYVAHRQARFVLLRERPRALLHMRLPQRYRALVRERHMKLIRERRARRRKLLRQYIRRHRKARHRRRRR